MALLRVDEEVLSQTCKYVVASSCWDMLLLQALVLVFVVQGDNLVESMQLTMGG
jgi:hypothetical protein